MPLLPRIGREIIRYVYYLAAIPLALIPHAFRHLVCDPKHLHAMRTDVRGKRTESDERFLALAGLAVDAGDDGAVQLKSSVVKIPPQVQYTFGKRS